MANQKRSLSRDPRRPASYRRKHLLPAAMRGLQPSPQTRDSGGQRLFVLSSIMWAGVITIMLLLLAVGVAVAGYAYMATQVPSPDNLWARSISFKSTKIYDRHGELLYLSLIHI